jgi:hypothetical protein
VRLSIAFAAIFVFASVPAMAEEAALPSERYTGCQVSDRRIEGVCEAADDVHAHLAALSPSTHRRRWAELHYALSVALFSIGVTGDDAALRDSVTASRVSAEYYTRGRTPTRWAAIQLHIAGALISLGDEASVTEAIDVSRAAVAAINRAQQPQLWASAQMSLGDALRLHARRVGDRQALLEAAAAVRAALEIYRRPSLAEHRTEAQRLLEAIMSDLGEGEPDRT